MYKKNVSQSRNLNNTEQSRNQELNVHSSRKNIQCIEGKQQKSFFNSKFDAN